MDTKSAATQTKGIELGNVVDQLYIGIDRTPVYKFLARLLHCFGVVPVQRMLDTAIREYEKERDPYAAIKERQREGSAAGAAL